MRWFARTLILSLGLIFPVAATAQTQTVAPPRLNGLSGAGAVETGQRVVLSPIFASGTSQLPYQYQWRMNGTVLPGVSATSLIIEGPAPPTPAPML